MRPHPLHRRAAQAAADRDRALAAAMLVSALLAAGSAAASDSLTVDACAALAAARAPGVAAARAAGAAAASDSMAVRHNSRPEFSIGARATIAPHGFYDPVVTDLGVYETKLAAEWSLRDGGGRARERARAGLDASASSADLAGASRDAGRDAAGAALELLRRRDGERAQAEMLEWLERLATELESGARAGSRGRAEVTRAQIDAAGVRGALLESREASAAVARALDELLARSDTGAVRLAEPDAGAEALPAAEDSVRLMERAARLPDLRLARIEEERARLALEDARRRNTVRVGLQADAGLAGADLTSAVPQALRDENPDATFADRLRQDLGASVSIEVHRPLADPASAPTIDARERSLEAARVRRDAAEARARREVFDLLGRWRLAHDRLAIARQGAERAEENLLRMRSLHAGGGIGLLDLLDARRQASDARDRLADARLDVRRAYYDARLP